MSLKDNFNQAVKEILKKDGLVGDDLSKESRKKSELDRYIDPPRAAEQPAPDPFAAAAASEPEPAAVMPDFEDTSAFADPEPIAPVQEPVRAAAPEPDYAQDYNRNPYVQTPQSAAGFGARTPSPDPYSSAGRSADPFGTANKAPDPFASAGSRNTAGGFGGGNVPPVSPRMGGTPPYRGGGNDTPYYETEETTVISRNTIIDGNIRSFANINIDGSVKGDVKITKNISVTGKVVGDIECNNSVMTGASMQGNIASKGQVQLDRDSILLGDISAQYLDLNGKIKGNIDVGGKAEFKSDAIILGNITASTITVLDGATIQGYVNTTFLQESSSSIFPDAIAVTE